MAYQPQQQGGYQPPQQGGYQGYQQPYYQQPAAQPNIVISNNQQVTGGGYSSGSTYLGASLCAITSLLASGVLVLIAIVSAWTLLNPLASIIAGICCVAMAIVIAAQAFVAGVSNPHTLIITGVGFLMYGAGIIVVIVAIINGLNSRDSYNYEAKSLGTAGGLLLFASNVVFVLQSCMANRYAQGL